MVEARSLFRAAVLGFALVGGLAAQTISNVPVVQTFQDVDRPFPGGVGRYQQWFSAASLQNFMTEPMRIEQVQFLAGSTLTSNTATIDCELLLGHGHSFGVTGTYDNNFSSPPVVIGPRALRQLSAGAPGMPVMTVPFASLFTWDHQRPLVLEIRVYGNSFSNQPFVYNFRGSTGAIGQTTRVYIAGSAGATNGNVTAGVGMITRFSARPGAVVDFGAGCVGGGGATPKYTVGQVPSPGILWTHTLTQAAPQQIALWVIGNDRTMIDGIPLPLDFPALLGTGPSGCMLRTNILLSGFYITVGGAPGAGVATFDWQLPPVTSYVGDSWYSQWFVLDPISPNGLMTASQAIHSIVAPVGG